MDAASALSCNCVLSLSFFWLVSFPPLRERDAISTSHSGHTTIAPLASLLVLSACWSTSMFNHSSRDRGLFRRSTCYLTQRNLMFTSLHQLSNRSCTVAMRYQYPFVLKNILSVMGLFAANTADSLSHRNRTDLILIRPGLKSVPSAASPAMMLPSSNRYDVRGLSIYRSAIRPSPTQ
jgi:hypothetical protein